MCLRAILVISGTYWFKTFSKRFYSYFLVSVICLLHVNGRQVRWWLHPQSCSLYIDLSLCQNWCFYQKMHNRLAYPSNYRGLLFYTPNIHCVREKVNLCIQFHNFHRQSRILTKFRDSNTTSNGIQITKFQ